MTNPDTHTIVCSVEFRSFTNMLRILRSLDAYEVPFMTLTKFREFCESPYLFFMSADDETAAQLWLAIQKRQPSFEEYPS